MYIKEIVIDGFKSYGHRTEVKGFDPQFNAITGLNGSGKSNVLDAICFVLGISNLSQVRAANLQELVYKCGQAGVTKASVSVVFDNRNKEQSPIGYENFDELTITRQIVVGGRNKYLINGTTATNTRVHDMFHSVQLNVNNPHFLIMQGRINKVLNMKPPEILSLLEEAAGTKLYEAKKESALKTIEKKNFKLQEIQKLLAEEINPTITKLRQDRSQYLEYQNVIRRLEFLTKYVIAFDYKCLQETQRRSADELEQMKEQIEAKKQELKDTVDSKTRLQEELEDMGRERDELAGPALESLEGEVSEFQKDLVLAEGELQRAKDAVKTEQKNQDVLLKECRESEGLLGGKKQELDEYSTSHNQLVQRHTHAKEALKIAEQQFQAVQQGMALAEEGEEGESAPSTLEEQLRVAQGAESRAKSLMDQTELRLKHLRSEYNTKMSQLHAKQRQLGRQSQGMDLDQLEKQKQDLQGQVGDLEKQIAALNFSPEAEDQFLFEVQKEQREFRNQQQEVATQASRFPQLQFQYQTPYPNFDHRAVKGVVAKLVQVKDPMFAMALEVCAGGRLYNIVTDTEQTCKTLVDKGQLARRFTFLPLNKISGQTIPAAVLHKAQQLVGEDNVWDPMHLITFDNELRRAMEFVFGGSLICRDLNTARKVAFQPGIERRTVTLEGDTFDPRGTLSGGARAQRASLLQQLLQLHQMEKSLADKEAHVRQSEERLNQMRQLSEQFNKLQHQKGEKMHQIRLLMNRLQQNELHQMQEELDSFKTDIQTQENVMNEARANLEKQQGRVASIKEKIANAAEYREKARAQAAQRLNAAQKRYEECERELEGKKTHYDTLKIEIEELEKEIAALKESVAKSENDIAAAKENIVMKQERWQAAKDAVAAAKQKLKDLKAQIAEFDAKINSTKKVVQKAGEQCAALELHISESNYKVETHIKESKHSAQRLAQLETQNPWILNERHMFGEPDTPYDFERRGHIAESWMDPKEARVQVERLREQKDKLSRTVNMRAMNMLGQAEEQYAQLVQRRETVLKDKGIMEAFIEELDRKKNETLLKAFEQVNVDFGSIFTTLLPGTQAKLKPQKQGQALEGLEFGIAFSGVWKESLGELSGGQRSLVALSYVLALLRFKPAPLYILDEVDAALDLSHTQNIGQLIKNHFQGAQFIVVSLKDGMFNNANVLFKTQFVDGYSTVTRHCHRPTVGKK